MLSIEARDLVVLKTLGRLAATLCLILAATIGGGASAQTTPAPTPIPQDQFDALVKAITQSVLEKLKAEGTPAPKPAEQKHGRFDANAAEPPDDITLFVRQAGHVMSVGIPAFFTALAEFATALDSSSRGGLGRSRFLLLLLATAAVAVALEAALRWLTMPAHGRLAAKSVPALGVRSLVSLGALALIDGAGVLLVWLVYRAAVHFWFRGTTVQDVFGAAVLLAIVYWRLYVFVFRLIVRPVLPAARLCDMSDGEAWRMLRLVSLIVLIAALLRALNFGLMATPASPDAVAAWRVLSAPVILVILLVFTMRSRDAARHWLVGLARVAPWNGFLGVHWVPVAGTVFVALIATQVYGAITEHLNAPTAVLLTLNLIIGLLLFETALQALVRRLDSQLEGFTPADDRQRLPDVLARCARVFVLILVIVFIAESWVVNVLGLIDARAWDRLTSVGRSIGLTLFTAFVLWELFKYAIEAYVYRISQKSLAGGDGRQSASSVAARFDTLMPMIRVTVATIIAVIAALVALDELGVNTAPLLAGASVLGLAISFGSQTLVKDIVSGIFYLADDAFRVGEYINCGQGEGTVEGFTLRSIRLRHRDGQLQVIPFGDLGRIANYSRDWAAIKFNMRFARDTDLEKLREATKSIGAELMEEPELKADIIEPLRIHSVAEVADNALVVRFKLKVRPGTTGAIQDRALRQMLKGMPQLGIAFAT
jgi:small-conductance mechanosensitive channel